MNGDKIALLGIVGLLTAVFVYTFTPEYTYQLATAIFILSIILYIIKGNKYALVFIALFFVGMIISYASLREPETAHLSGAKNFTAIITKEARIVGEGEIRYEAKIKDSKKVNVLITLPSQFAYKIGDCVEFDGRALGALEEPQNFADFDYKNFLKKDDIYFLSKFPKEVEVISDCDIGAMLSFRRKLQEFKDWFIGNIRKNVKEPEGALSSGIVIGGKSVLPEQLEEDLRKVGTIHIAVLSGYNITLVSDMATKLFSYLPLMLGGIFTIIIIILFSLTAGLEPPIVRAMIMAIILVIARVTKRENEALRGLLTAIVIMILLNPLILRYDVSFHLTILASIGIFFFTPVVIKFLPRQLRGNGIVFDIFRTTLATQLLILPYALYQFSEVSAVSVLANLLTLIVVPTLMLVTIVGGVLVAIPLIGFIGEALLLITSLISSYIIFIAEFLSEFSFATLSFQLNTALMILCYVFYGWIFYKYRDAIKERKTSVTQLAN